MENFINCEICSAEMNMVWHIEHSVAPNRYRHNVSEKGVESEQRTYYCETCDYVKNSHDLTMDAIFSDYIYRSPDTIQDIEIADYLSEFISLNRIKSVIEVGGNNGVFASKILVQNSCVQSYHIIDKIPLAVIEPRLSTLDTYLSAETDKMQADLVIVRHAFAHNPSITNFAKNIVDRLGSKYIYIECADWVETRHNNDYSQLYSEHFYGLSAQSVKNLFAPFQFGVVDEKRFEIHNGSFGVLLRKMELTQIQSAQKTDVSVNRKIQKWGEATKDLWLSLSNQEIIIWGCSAKIVFLINALQLDVSRVVTIHDSTVSKLGKYPPGIDIAIEREPFEKNMLEVNVIIGAKNFKDQLLPKIKKQYPNANVVTL